MKKIYYHEIVMTQSYNEGTGEPIYEIKKEQFECEYSEEWTKDDADPIKDYVENMIENATGESIEDAGYSWEGNNTSLDFGDLTYTGAAHILYDKNGDPVSIYYIKEVEND